MKRRDFLKLVGSSSMAYIIGGCSDRESLPTNDPSRTELELVDFEILCRDTPVSRNFSDLVLFLESKKVAVYTGRSELGQGLTTVLVSAVSRAFEIPPEAVEVHLADTAICPDDGPTNGSCATSNIVWPIWCACLEIRQDMVVEGARRLELEPSEVGYQNAAVFSKAQPTIRVSVFDLNRDGVKFTNPETVPEMAQSYRDPGLKSVRGRDMVTGRIQYAGDVMSGDSVYGGFFTPPEIHFAHHFKPAGLKAVAGAPGVLDTGAVKKLGSYIVAETFPALQQAMSLVKNQKAKPKAIDFAWTLADVRKQAHLVHVIEEKGDALEALKSCKHTLSETYSTHHYNVAFMEPQTSVAIVKSDGVRVWDSTQHAHRQQKEVAKATGFSEEKVHVTGTNVGGGFGGKIANRCASEAATIARETGLPIKRVFTRAEVFRRYSRAKEEVAVDLVSGVDGKGRFLARAIDVYQDEGFGFADIYDIPNSKVQLFRVKPDRMPIRHATIRGTSYTQDVFAMESHVDSLANSIKMDPLDFRLKNVLWHEDLLNAAAEMIDYGRYRPPRDHGVGMAIINHGSRQLGALFVEVAVDRKSGRIKIKRLRAAFDIGVVMCETTAKTGIYGALIWGISISMKEQIRADRSRILTDSFSDYEIARFSDVPDIEFKFLKTYSHGQKPRGCGEMPLPLVGPAVANAVFNAVGVRLYSTPFTPEKVLAALRNVSGCN